MPPVQVSFTGFAIIGLTLVMLALTIAISLVRLSHKSTATRWLSLFFACVAASGLATLLTNGLLFWNSLFAPWQDVCIIIGGGMLSQFAYRFPRFDQPREARLVAAVYATLALVSVAYSAAYSVRYATQWSPEIAAADAFYTLLPLGTLLMVAIFLRRSLHFSALTQAETGGQPQPAWQRLIRPVGHEARGFRSFAMALALGILPALVSLFPVPGPYDFLLMNIGSLLAMAMVALMYYNYTPQMNSFMAKLVGVTLVTVLLIVSVTGTFEFRRIETEFRAQQTTSIAATAALLSARQIESIPAQVAYIATWPTAKPDELADRQLVYTRSDVPGSDVRRLLTQPQMTATPGNNTIARDLATLTSMPWQWVRHYGTYPVGSTEADFAGYRFSRDAATFEIGLRIAESNEYLSATAVRWMGLLLLSSLCVLVFFPIFFQHMLVNPLARLLEGVSRVNQGDLTTSVAIQYYDEIGSLTGSFNSLTHTLKESYDVLEKRVTDRTRELSAFSDLTMLPSGNDELTDILQPALHRILEAGKCEALGLHLLANEGQTLQLFAYLYLPEAALDELHTIELVDAFAARVQQADTPLITSQLIAQADLPPALRVSPFQAYLGCPLTAGGQSLGWLSCYRMAETEFGMSEASFLVALARQVGVIIENHRLRQRISQGAVDEERQRLARELHDAVTQSLYSQLLFARACRDAAEEQNLPRLQANVQQLEASAGRALKEMRLLLYQLRPAALQHGQLSDAIAERLDLVERRLGLQAECRFATMVPLPADLEDMLYRVILEALNNALKHAQASAVQVELLGDETELHLSICDNGQGFEVDQATGGMGLLNMQNRVANFGGNFEIRAQPGQGTNIRISIPLTNVG